MARRICITIFFSLFTNFSPANFANAQEFPGPPKGYNPKNHAMVAVLQWAPEDPAPIRTSPDVVRKYMQQNRETLAGFIEEAHRKGAQMVVTPELSVIAYPEEDYSGRADIAPFTETIPGPSTHFFSQLSKKLKIFIQFGIAEKDSNNIFYNAAVVTGPDGNIVAKYRKINLFGDEYKYFEPGEKAATFDGPFGPVGVIICADIYNTYPLSEYKKNGVKTISMGASWTVPDPMNWFSWEARQNQMNLLAANHPYFPDSGVINSDGSIQSHIKKTVGLAYGFFPVK